jgi:hypothetical protein
MFFASYRARRYKLARTRWRGIRFGMERAAWGYTWRACLFLLISIVTLGLLHPLMWFKLEQYKTDRSWYGDAQMVQGGRWTGLYRSMKHIFIGLGVIILAVVVGAFAAWKGAGAVVIFLISTLCYVWLLFGILYYWVQGTAWLTRNKSLRLADGGTVPLAMEMRTRTILGHYLLGGLAVGGIVFAGSLVLRVIGMALKDVVAGAPPVLLVVMGALVYLAVLTLISALSLAFIRQPILGYMIGQVSVLGADDLAAVRQRGAEAGADADGFAEALDLGGAF